MSSKYVHMHTVIIATFTGTIHIAHDFWEIYRCDQLSLQNSITLQYSSSYYAMKQGVKFT